MIAIQEETNGAARDFPAGALEYCGTGYPLRIEQSIAYMVLHLDKPLKVATLAAQANVSSSHFFALFKRRIGSAPAGCWSKPR